MGDLVSTHVVPVDHLRLDLTLLVYREQSVVDQVAVIPGGSSRLWVLRSECGTTLSVTWALAFP
jgi:hypothetical protein